ncbi:MAG: AmmeMemoRadiSam system radical SAM enzyme, partial [candidate division NC10 bacterium]|nr:AmmeMemoRadiSam system radical SAM enzyme [candidate division NC10 bacterium]
MRREAILYERWGDRSVRCQICQRRCRIPQGHAGWCRTRVNEGGSLFSLTYGEVSSLSIHPIEKKPVFHFYPGSSWLSLGSLGCNFRCPGCQNWEIAHWRGGSLSTQYRSPQEVLSRAKQAGCLGISFTFNEPTLWLEYTMEAAELAKSQGLYTNYVTNGFITQEALARIAPFLDVWRVDIKAFSDSTYERIGNIPGFRGILEIAEEAMRKNMHLEVVTNLVAGCNDSEEELRGIASWIKNQLGPETPWHLTRFHPPLQLSHLPITPLSTLEKAW